MRAEHLLRWPIAATRDDAPDAATNWQKAVAIVPEAFSAVMLAEDCMSQTVVLIPKRKIGNFRGIGMVEVI